MSNDKEDKSQKIGNYIDFIKKYPKEVNFFALDVGRKFIVDGKKIKLLPTEYSKHNTKDEFYISVNPDLKKVIFYSCMIVDYTTEEKTDEELGHFEWDKVQNQILGFIVLHLSDLSTSSTPYKDSEKINGGCGFSTSHTPANQPYPPYTPPTYNNDYTSKDYKDRTAITDKLIDLLKANKTSLAIDHITTSIAGMCENKKFDSLDCLLKYIALDRLTIPAMLAILDATRGADHILKDRKEFFFKVKNHLAKVRSSKIDNLLCNMEPGKEYKNIKKYENAAVASK